MLISIRTAHCNNSLVIRSRPPKYLHHTNEHYSEFRLFFPYERFMMRLLQRQAARQSCPMIIMTTSTGPAEPCGLGCTPGIVLSKHAHTCITIGDPQLLFSRGTDLLIVSILVACSHKLSITYYSYFPVLFFSWGPTFPHPF